MIDTFLGDKKRKGGTDLCVCVCVCVFVCVCVCVCVYVCVCVCTAVDQVVKALKDLDYCPKLGSAYMHVCIYKGAIYYRSTQRSSYTGKTNLKIMRPRDVGEGNVGQFLSRQEKSPLPRPPSPSPPSSDVMQWKNSGGLICLVFPPKSNVRRTRNVKADKRTYFCPNSFCLMRGRKAMPLLPAPPPPPHPDYLSLCLLLSPHTHTHTHTHSPSPLPLSPTPMRTHPLYPLIDIAQVSKTKRSILWIGPRPRLDTKFEIQ